MLRFSVTWLLSNYSVIFGNPVHSVWTVADDLYVSLQTVISVCSENEFLPVCAKFRKLGGKTKKTAAFFQKLFTEALCYLVQDARGKSFEECEV